jgi:hypothetical protein
MYPAGHSDAYLSSQATLQAEIIGRIIVPGQTRQIKKFTRTTKKLLLVVCTCHSSTAGSTKRMVMVQASWAKSEALPLK